MDSNIPKNNILLYDSSIPSLKLLSKPIDKPNNCLYLAELKSYALCCSKHRSYLSQ